MKIEEVDRMQNHRIFQELGARKLMEEQLVRSLKEGLPLFVTLTAYNLSRAGISFYGLLARRQENKPTNWLTIRLADHPLWLLEAQQVSIEFGNPADLLGITAKVQQFFQDPQAEDYFYDLLPLEIAVLQFLDECQKQGLIWAVRLPEAIFAGHKKFPLDLKSDFMKADLFLGDRNNLNNFMLPVEAKSFQAALAVLFGRNLLFAQFSRGRLLRLLPTNQWIQPIIKQRTTDDHGWEKQLSDQYGEQLIAAYEKAKQSRDSNFLL